VKKENNIRVFREALEMSQLDLAIEVDTSVSAISTYERGAGMRNSTRIRIADALDEPAAIVFPGVEFPEL